MSKQGKSSAEDVLFSVVIPVYNRPEMLLRAVQSVLIQEGVNFELIVVDDGSDLDQRHAESVVKGAGHTFIRKDNAGVSSARNVGIEKSAGSFVAFLDSDDEWLPGKLSAQATFHRDNPDCQISQTDEIWIRHGKRVNRKKYHLFAQGESFELCCERCAISPSSVVMSRTLLEELGGFNESFAVCEDYEFWLRVSSRYSIGFLDELLIRKYGGHEDQLSHSRPALDCFRLRALLLLAATAPLREEQYRALSRSIVQKANILATGAKKGRGKWESDFGAIGGEFSGLSSSSSQDEIVWLAKKFLPTIEPICRVLDSEKLPLKP